MILHILTGPPKDPAMDRIAAERFCGLSGRKIACGGTTVRILSGFLQSEPEILWESGEDGVPPWGILRGTDMVTEGVHTLKALTDRLETSNLNYPPNPVKTLDKLVEYIVCCPEIHFYAGLSEKKYNDEPVRGEILEDLFAVLKKLKRNVIVHILQEK